MVTQSWASQAANRAPGHLLPVKVSLWSEREVLVLASDISMDALVSVLLVLSYPN